MYLGFDVGGTYTKYALLNEDGEITEKDKVPSPVNPGDGQKEFLQLLSGIYGNYRGRVRGIAISLPGQVDVEKGIVYGGGNLPYLDGMELGKELSALCDGVPVALENDGKSAALAEAWKGNAADVDNAFVLVFGTGIAGAFIHDKRVYRGNHLRAGEVSGLIAEYSKDQIMRSRRGDGVYYSWAEFYSTRALCYKVGRMKGLQDPDKMTGEEVYRLAAAGDMDSLEALDDMYFNIAKHCMEITLYFDPDIILIGGGISAEPEFIRGIARYTEYLSGLSRLFRDIRIGSCRFRNDSNLIGALYNYFQLYEPERLSA